ncbi:hypothetical protein DPMN_167807 [Dreissena polymorpha]|uniref:Uncharacterized protein n=1 Tax=Dreissena polymorpha TaxID=45954 RepID=A0A9D4IYY6_DREPO|nr:hypothetical protein DPMN_167807 [Dreissena polymorpha]
MMHVFAPGLVPSVQPGGDADLPTAAHQGQGQHRGSGSERAQTVRKIHRAGQDAVPGLYEPRTW